MSTTLNDSFMAGTDHAVQIQRTYRPPVVYGERDPRQHIYYHVRALRNKACEIPETADISRQKQEVVRIPLWEEGPQVPDGISVHSPSICLQMQGIRVEIHEHAGADVIRNTLLALHQLC